MEQRIGIGIDYHPFKQDRKLILGAVHIPHPYGLDGHSDADVLLHAICDAMLGALALGDIGIHFPNTDERYKDKESLFFLQKVNELIHQKGFQVGNIDSMLLIETPKVSPFIPKMKDHIATTLHIDNDSVSIKATTTEKMGFIGREEGVAAHAVVILKKYT